MEAISHTSRSKTECQLRSRTYRKRQRERGRVKNITSQLLTCIITK